MSTNQGGGGRPTCESKKGGEACTEQATCRYYGLGVLLNLCDLHRQDVERFVGRWPGIRIEPLPLEDKISE